MRGFLRSNGYPAKANRPGVVIALLGLTLLGISISVPRSSAQAQQTITKPLEHEVGVALKLIHVYVTDKKGKPVPDLSREDFELFDNGTPVTVTEFERHLSAGLTQEAGPKPSDEIVPAKALPQPALVPQFILFFDFAYNNLPGINKAKQAALHFVNAETERSDEISVFSYSPLKGLTVHEYSTRDRQKVLDTIQALDPAEIVGRAEDVEEEYQRSLAGSEMAALESRSSGQTATPTVTDSFARSVSKAQVRNFVTKMADLARALRYTPGKKNILLFSTGIPSSILYGAGGSLGDFGDPVLRRLSEDMVKELSAGDCTVFVFDTREKGTFLFRDDAARYESNRAGVLSRPSATDVFRDTRTTGVSSLRRMSQATGGTYFANIDEYPKDLELVRDMTGSYYVLGYRINERWDGRFHDIKVKVKRKGCEVRAQAGYFNPKPYGEYTKLEKELHLYDLALNERAFSRMPINVPLVPLVYGGGAGQRLGIVAGIPGEVTAKLSGSRVEYVVIFFDDKGEVSKVVRAETDPASYRSQAMIFAAGAELGPGTYSCRLVARDMDTGLSAVGSAVATIGKARTTGLQLSTPLLLTEGATGVHFDAGPARKRDALPLGDVYAYDKSRLQPATAELPAGSLSIWALVPYWVPGEAEPDLAFSAYVIDARSAARTPLRFSGVERIRGGPQGLLSFEIPVAELAPGTYFLHFHGEDRASRSVGHTSTTLIIPQR
jgi:VWFA-related protein